MEAKINIAEILKDKTVGTKLWSPICGECTLHLIKMSNPEPIEVAHGDNGGVITLSRDGKYFLKGESVLFPSKQMRDCDKFAWKKGDVLHCGVDNFCIFEKWYNEDYTEFGAKFVTPNYSGNTFKTEKWYKETNEAVIKQYISNIEEFKGGKLNLATLEIEKQTEFKDGDIVTAVFTNGNEMICVFKEKIEQDYMAYCGFFSKGKREGDVFMDLGYDCIYNDDPICKEIRFATEEEKQQLFEALAKKNKAWDAEKKAIVDLKPKCEFKPFDRCIWKIRNCEGSIWQASFVSYVDEYGATPIGMSIDEDLVNLIILPYNDQTKLLVGTTDEWKGGEQ